jgi:signal recognition particle subunit SEC65
MSNTNDQKIEQMKKVLNEKRLALGKRPRAQWNTNGIFNFGCEGKHFNLNTVVDLSRMARALAYMRNETRNIEEAAKDLGFTPDPVLFGNWTVDEWESDFRTRVAVVQWEKRNKELQAIEKKLNALMSEDARTANELADLEKLL